MTQVLVIKESTDTSNGVAQNKNIDAPTISNLLLKEISCSNSSLVTLKKQARINAEKKYIALENRRKKIGKPSKSLLKSRTKRQIDNVRNSEKYRLRSKELEKLLEIRLEEITQANFKVEKARTNLSKKITMVKLRIADWE